MDLIAKYDGGCSSCGGRIHAGARYIVSTPPSVRLDGRRQRGTARHAECPDRDPARQYEHIETATPNNCQPVAFVVEGCAEYHAMWAAVERHPLNEGRDEPLEGWQYMCTVQHLDYWIHQFRNRCEARNGWEARGIFNTQRIDVDAINKPIKGD